MARANAAMPLPPVAVAPVVKQAHGMSLEMKPARTPHPTAKGRDIHGRMLPGQLPANAAPPFKPGRAAKAVQTFVPPAAPLAINGRLPLAGRGGF